MTIARNAIGGLALSAAALVGIWQSEGWTEKAVIPVKGDVPTVGPGLTKRPDGSPVQMGDTIKPIEGAQRSLAHIQKTETALKRCVTAPLHQVEYDVLVDAAYQFGEGAMCRSDVVKNINVGRYAEACQAYAAFRFMTSPVVQPGWEPFRFDASGKPIRWRFDCATPGNRVCAGVWTRQKERINKCMSAQ